MERGKGRKMRWIAVGMLFGLFGVPGIFGGVPAMGQPPESWTAGIAYDVVPAAKITKISFYMEKTEAGPMLTYEVGIQNVSREADPFQIDDLPPRRRPGGRFLSAHGKERETPGFGAQGGHGFEVAGIQPGDAQRFRFGSKRRGTVKGGYHESKAFS